MNPTKAINLGLNSLTLIFSAKPPVRVLEALKGNRWRWSKRHRCWYADITDENHGFADALCAGQIPPIVSPTPPARPPESKSADRGMAQANEEAYFDNFCQRNNL